jgi:small subunit ribosomal protein S6e
MFKINISEKSGKTFKLESEAEALVGKSLHEKISGNEIMPELQGYEFEISGASDKAGFTAHEDVEGVGLKRLLLSYGKAMKNRPKREGKKKRSKNRPKGLRLRKTVRGKVISPDIVQINLKITKDGPKKLSEVFPNQNKTPEPEPKPEAQEQKAIESQTPVETTETPKEETEKPEEKPAETAPAQ